EKQSEAMPQPRAAVPPPTARPPARAAEHFDDGDTTTDYDEEETKGAARDRGIPRPGGRPRHKATSQRLARSMPRARGRSWIGRLLDWFRGSSESTVPDREPFRDRVRGLLREMQQTPGVAADQLAFLRGTATDLKALFRDLMYGGDRHPAVALL